MNAPAKSIIRFAQLLGVITGMSFSFVAPAFGLDGTNSSGGGDKCEKRIQKLRGDLTGWLKSPEARSVKLPKGVTFEQYSTAMLNKIEKTHFECVGKGDPHYPVTEDGRAKTCKWTESRASALITCDYEKFNGDTDSQQREQLHHEYASMAGFEKPKGPISNYDVTNDAANSFDLQIRATELMQTVDEVLLKNAHTLQMDPTGSFTGSIKGHITGEFSAQSRVSSVLGKGILGLLAGPTLVALAPALGTPLALGETLMASALGGGAGVVAGAAKPDKVATGNLSGEIEGEFKGKTWQNHYSSRYFAVIVVDPSQIQALQTLKTKGFVNSGCADQYEQLLQSVVRSKRYLTVEKARELLMMISQIRELAKKVYKDIPKQNALDKEDSRRFVAETKEWLAKKLTLMTIGLNGLEIQPQVLYRVDFKADLQAYQISRCGTFTCDSKLKSSTPAAPVYVPSSTPADQVLPLAAEKFNERINAEYNKNLAEHAKDKTGGIATGYYRDDDKIYDVKAVDSEFRFERGGRLPYQISTQSAQLLKAQNNPALCSSQNDLAALLGNTSASEDILFDSVSDDTIERHFSSESVTPIRLNHPVRE
jgi:hypothetical protein